MVLRLRWACCPSLVATTMGNSQCGMYLPPHKLAHHAAAAQVGLLPQLGACRAWQLLRPALSLEYSKELWRGTAQELAALRKPITAGSQVRMNFKWGGHRCRHGLWCVVQLALQRGAADVDTSQHEFRRLLGPR